MATNKASNTNEADASFSIGDKVELVGLQKSPHMNHRVGMVAGNVLLDSGRYPVMLNDKQVSIKPENLRGRGSSERTGTCYACHMNFSQKALKVCSGCKATAYCSQECQKAHWHKEHKNDCKMFQQARRARHNEAKLPSDPSDRHNVRHARARRWVDVGKYANAEAEYRAIIQENPDEYITTHSMLVYAICHQDPGQDKVDDAIAILRKAVKMPIIRGQGEKDVRIAYRQLGNLLYSEKDDLDGAEKAFNEVLKLGSWPNDNVAIQVKIDLEQIKNTRRELTSAAK